MAMKKRVQYAVFLAKKLHAQSVFNMAFQEGNPFTFVEVKTLLDGITVGGHKISDEDQVIRIAKAWQHLFNLVENEQFDVSPSSANAINGIVAEREALEWGEFRTADVSIAGTDFRPPSASELPGRFRKMQSKLQTCGDVEQRAFTVFLACARNQFYFDGNKRTGQLLMNGMLLTAGEPIASIPASRTVDYNALMLEYYETGRDNKIREFLADCRKQIRSMVRLRDSQV